MPVAKVESIKVAQKFKNQISMQFETFLASFWATKNLGFATIFVFYENFCAAFFDSEKIISPCEG